MNRLVEKYQNEITPALVSKFNYKSVMQVPKIEKIVMHRDDALHEFGVPG